MAERSEMEVDEERIMRYMAGDVPLLKAETPQPAEVENRPIEPAREETVEQIKTAKRKNVRQTDFEGTFLKEAKITDRRQMYISGDFYDKISAYLRIISDGKVSMVGYIHNVLAHHMLEFKDMINETYQSKINKSNPL